MYIMICNFENGVPKINAHSVLYAHDASDVHDVH